jgi:signal transduction histidine kinase/ActR/RegA family two-component response regulator
MRGQLSVGDSHDARAMRVVFWPPTRADGDAITKLLESRNLTFERVGSMTELCRAIRAGAGTAMLSEEALLADVAPLLDELSRQPVWSDLPLLILSTAGRESSALAAILGRLGNVSVVERPVRTSTLLSLIASSQRARARQYEVRRYLAEREKAGAEREQLLESERTARGEAERASRMKDEFLATLSHELRTPLHAVLGWTQVLRRTPQMSEEVAKGLSTIERNARAQARIIEELLDMSSIISGKVHLKVQQVDLAAIVTATADTVQPAAQAKGVGLQVQLDPHLGPVRGDPDRLQQILWNLMTNAVKFSRRGGQVKTTLAQRNSHLTVTVEDNGEGIDPGFLPHVFDRFRQADASRARSHTGLGLGLSIAKQLVELHGGTIAAHSAGRGAGATFRIELPLGPVPSPAGDLHQPGLPPEPETAAAAGVQAGGRDGLDGVKILVVDDERDSRLVMQRCLEGYGARVCVAASASEALACIGRSAPDVLVSDIGMPGQDGYELIRDVRALGGNSARIPAIALTAYARAEDRASAVRAGYHAHVAKPVEPSELVAVIRQLHMERTQ